MTYSNVDLAVVAPEMRHWKMRHYVALWMGMSFSIPAYMLASSLLTGGMSWWQALLCIFLGNSIVLIPMLLNSHAGTKYGIPFPVYVRASFGIKGANIPAIIRAIIACGWFGIQSWIGSEAVYGLIAMIWPKIALLPDILPSWVGLSSGHFIAFSLFWLLNMTVVFFGMNLMRKLLSIQSLLLIIISLVLIFWGAEFGSGMPVLLNNHSSFDTNRQFWNFFLPSITGVVGFFSTIVLNITDFTRYAESQRAQMLGQALSLPFSMTLITFVGVFVTAVTTLILGKIIWDPVLLVDYIPSLTLRVITLLTIVFITLVANVALNIVSPANDFSNLKPAIISFKVGGLITGIIGFLIMPWKLINDPNGYIFTWLTGVSALLGTIVGIMLCDYFLIRKQSLNVQALYDKGNIYWYRNGFNYKAIIALIAGIILNIPGFLAQVKVIPMNMLPSVFKYCYDYAWFIGFIVSAITYWLLMRTQHDSERI